MSLERLPIALRLAAFGGAVAVLLWLSLAPVDALPPVSFWDKAEHALAYVVLTGLGLILFASRWRLVLGGVFLLGALIEVLQSVMGLGRQGDLIDLLADALGIAVAVGVAVLLRLVLNLRGRVT